MLVLTRKQGETICVGDQIKLTVLEIRGHCVRIGIQAPKDVNIVRAELIEFQADESIRPTEDDTGNLKKTVLESPKI